MNRAGAAFTAPVPHPEYPLFFLFIAESPYFRGFAVLFESMSTEGGASLQSMNAASQFPTQDLLFSRGSPDCRLPSPVPYDEAHRHVI
jgi:hypothetical protein